MEPAREHRWKRALSHLALGRPITRLVVAVLIIGAGLGGRAVLDYSTPDILDPTPPSRVIITEAKPSKVALRWTPATDAVGVTGYTVYRNGSAIGSTTSSNYSDNDSTPATKYTYSVSASDEAANESIRSRPISVSTPPDTSSPTAPTNLRQTGSSLLTISIAWNSSSDNVAVTSYDIYRNGTLIRAKFGTTFTDTNLNENTRYSYALVARDRDGNMSPKTTLLAVNTATDKTAPSVPENVYETARTNTTTTVAWTPSIDSPGNSTYQIYRNGTLIGSSKTNSYKDTKTRINTDYMYTVSSVDPRGNQSAQSMPFSTAKSNDTEQPSAPRDVHTAGVTINSIDLAWKPATDNVAVSGYKIYRDNSLVGTAKTNTFRDTGLKPATDYRYSIQAYDATSNTSARSDSIYTQTALLTTVRTNTPSNSVVISQKNRSVSIVVNAANGLPQPGAHVSLDGATATADRDGKVMLNAHTGKQKITVRYADTTVHKLIVVDTNSGATAAIQINLSPRILSSRATTILIVLAVILVLLCIDAVLLESRLHTRLRRLPVTPRRHLNSVSHAAMTTANPKRMATLPKDQTHK